MALTILNSLPRRRRGTEADISGKASLWWWHLCLFLLFYCVLPSLLHAAGPICLRCHPAHYAERGRCTSCHRGNDRAARQALAHHELIPGSLASFSLPDSPARERGKKLADLLACRRCHALERRGNRLASNLDQVAATTPIASIRQAILTPAWYMPDFRLASADVDTILTYLLFAGKAVRKSSGPAEAPQVIHFADERATQDDPFTRHCGGCHMTLTGQDGGLGRGRVAPNLAGLLGEQYPKTYRRAEPWTPATLRHWLNNPRASRPLATMPPVRLEEHVVRDLTRQIMPSTR